MADKMHGADPIFGKLPEAEIAEAHGGLVPNACRRMAIAVQKYCRRLFTIEDRVCEDGHRPSGRTDRTCPDGARHLVALAFFISHRSRHKDRFNR